MQIPTDTPESGLETIALNAVKKILPSCSPVYEGTVKHVFSHRIHLLSVCSTTMNEKDVKVNDYEWWSSQQIRDYGTTTWFLLVFTISYCYYQMLKTAHRATASLKRLK